MKWVFKLKSDNCFSAHLVAMGLKKIPGIDYQTSHSPVLTDIYFSLILILNIQRCWYMMPIDIDKAFLEPKIYEDIYITVPQVLYHTMNIDRKLSIFKLNKEIYGLVQASKNFYLTITDFLISLDYVISKSDPCLAIKTTN